MENSEHKSAQNYELLIRIDEQLKNFTREVRESNAGFDRRIAIIESSKIEKDEAIKMYVDAGKVTSDHETRLRTVEEIVSEVNTRLKTWGTVAVTSLAILQLILKFI
jgi:hypothetical protein